MAEIRLEVTGIVAALGVAVGHVHLVPRPGRAVRRRASDRPAEVARLRDALDASREELESARDALDPEMALVLDAQLLMHRDELLIDATIRGIEHEGLAAEWALERAVSALEAPLLASPNHYFRERAQDVVHVGDHILRHLRGERDRLTLPPRDVVVLAADLSPADAVRLLGDPRVRGLVTDAGSATSHTALLARAFEVPTIVGARGLFDRVEGAPEVIVDALHGRVVVHPEQDERVVALERGTRFRGFATELRERAREAPRLRDGELVEVLANIELPAEAAAACAHGAAGVGLYRTEFLYLEHGAAPSEEAQLEVYREVLQGAAPRGVVFRTFDLGGDKVPSGGLRRAAVGQNPALGLRALRLALRRPDLFRTQVRAILRAGAEGSARLLLPLVTSIAELRLARAIIDSCAEELAAEGKAYAPVEVGAMIEVPAAALLVDRLAAEVDFLSVGTNDLVQYTLAVDRGDPEVASLADPLDPAVLTLLGIITRGAGATELTMCGDMASDPVALPIVLGLGFRRLSVPLASLPFVAETVRRLDGAGLAALAEEALAASAASEVRALVHARLGDVLGSLWTEQGVQPAARMELPPEPL